MSDLTWGRGWGGTFETWDNIAAATLPEFGPPFLDLRSAIRLTLGVSSPMISAIGINSRLETVLELQSKLPSPRIDRSSL